MRKNNIYLLAGGLAVIILAVGGLLFWVNAGRAPDAEDQTPREVITESYEKIDPEDIGLTLSPRADGKAVILKITELEDLSSVEYELSYLAKGDIPRGVIGTIQVKPGDREISRELLLGTCSRNVCKYDEGVTSVTLIGKVTKTDGKIYSVEQTLDL